MAKREKKKGGFLKEWVRYWMGAYIAILEAFGFEVKEREKR